METVLVTGASGFLGSRVMEALARRNRYKLVAVTSHRNIQNSNWGGEYSGSRPTF